MPGRSDNLPRRSVGLTQDTISRLERAVFQDSNYLHLVFNF
jgi:hypothetical protein